MSDSITDPFARLVESLAFELLVALLVDGTPISGKENPT